MTATAIYIRECVLFFHKNNILLDTNLSQINYPNRSINYTHAYHRLSMAENGAYYMMCIRIYNNLSLYLKEITHINQFKRNIYHFLLEMEPYSLNDSFSWQNLYYIKIILECFFDTILILFLHYFILCCTSITYF